MRTTVLALAAIAVSVAFAVPSFAAAKAGTIMGTVGPGFTIAGTVAHNFDIAGVKAGPFVDPGTSATMTVNVQAGRGYSYQCDVPGHAQLGMRGTFTPSP
jgi:plastocyanin